MLRSFRKIPFWAKVFVGFIVIIMTAVSVVYYFTNEVIFAQFQEFTSEIRLRQARSFSPFFERQLRAPPGQRPDIRGLPREISDFIAPIGRHIMIADLNGVIVAAADESMVGQQFDREQFEVIQELREGRGGAVIAFMLAGPGLTEPTELETAFLSSINRAIMFSGIVAAVLGLLMALWLIQQVTTPLRKLATATEEMSQGNLSQRVDIESHDAIGQLGDSFNTMSDRLARSEELRRNMIADIAHELRTPLTLIQGNLQAIIDGIYDPSTEKIESIHEKSILLSRLISDLQELSLAESGEIQLNRRRADIVNLVLKATEGMIPRFEEKRLQLSAGVPDVEIWLEIDTERISQVLINMLNNARKYTDEGGQISVSLSESSEEVTISVRDTGEGIAQEDLQNVFERFWRADSSRARVSGGSGLGLAVAKQWVESHGGQIWVESEKGKGSSFSFSLPKRNQDSDSDSEIS